MVPVAWALRGEGHDVLVATQPALVDDVVAAGLPVAPVGRDHDLWRVARLAPAGPAGIPALGLGADPTWEYLLGEYRRVVPWWWRLINEPMLADLVDLCRRWRPHLVVWEAVTFAGAVAARACGAAHVRFLFGSDLPGRLRREFLRARPVAATDDPLAQWLDRCAHQFGGSFHEDMTTGQASVTFLPEPLRIPAADGPLLPVRYVPYNGRCVVPGWVLDRPRRPRVGISLGRSSIERLGTYPVRVPDLLEALSALDVEVVATVSADDPAAALPGNARLVGFVPLHALAASCSVVVNHGGPGTMCTTLGTGVPQLVLPGMYDEPLLGDLLTRTGAGLALAPDEWTVERIADFTRRLLTLSAHRDAARALQATAMAMPTPDLLSRALESVAA
ncbi:MAG: nucleotide disphospho-sugar-binding domain-containing protein [Kineosporiaceae bacterium]